MLDVISPEAYLWASLTFSLIILFCLYALEIFVEYERILDASIDDILPSSPLKNYLCKHSAEALRDYLKRDDWETDLYDREGARNFSITILLRLYELQRKQEDLKEAKRLLLAQKKNIDSLINRCTLYRLQNNCESAKDMAIKILLAKRNSDSVLLSKCENEYSRYILLRAETVPIHDYSSVLNEYRRIFIDTSFRKLSERDQGYCHWLMLKIAVRLMKPWEPQVHPVKFLRENAIERLIDLSFSSDEILQMEFWLWLAELQLTSGQILDELDSDLTRLKSMGNDLPCDVSIPVCYEKALSNVSSIQSTSGKHYSKQLSRIAKGYLWLAKQRQFTAAGWDYMIKSENICRKVLQSNPYGLMALHTISTILILRWEDAYYTTHQEKLHQMFRKYKRDQLQRYPNSMYVCPQIFKLTLIGCHATLRLSYDDEVFYRRQVSNVLSLS